MPRSAPPPRDLNIYSQLRRQQRQIRDYLIRLAAAEGPDRRTFWKDQIDGAFLGNPAIGEELELLEQHFEFEEDPDRTKAMTAFWAMNLLTVRDLEDNTDEIIQIVHQALHYGGRRIPNNYFDHVIISDYNVSEVTKTITKITLLRYLAHNQASIRRFIENNPEEVEQHYPHLLELNEGWITQQTETFSDIINHPYNYIGYSGAPWSRIPAPRTRPQVRERRQPPLTPWQQLWQAYRNESPQGDFNFLLSFYRTNKFFCSLNKRIKAPVTNAPFWTRQFYRIIFWLNVPLVLDTIYYQFWVLLKTTLKVSFDYLLARPQQPITSLAPAKKWCELLLTILFAPFILLIPLVLGLISIPFNATFLLIKYCFHNFLEAYPDVAKFIKLTLTAGESWIKFRLFIYYLNQWSQFLGRFITIPPQLMAATRLGSVVIGIGVAIAYLLLQIWEKNFDFESVIDDTFTTLLNTVMDDPLTHLVTVAALFVTPTIFACLVVARLFLGIVTGNIFRSDPDDSDNDEINQLRETQRGQVVRLNRRLHKRSSPESQAQNDEHAVPIVRTNRTHRTRSRTRAEANVPRENAPRRSSRGSRL